MPRIVHGFRISRHPFYVPIIAAVVLVPITAAFFLGKIGGISLSNVLGQLGLSVYRLFFAYLVSIIIAYLLAIPVSQSRVGNFFISVFDLLQNLPSFALIPVFVLIFGYTSEMAIIFTASSMLWPILFYVLHSLKTAHPDLGEAATVFGARGWKRAIYFLLPLSVPAAVTGSIVGFSIGWEAVIGVEIIGLSNGIGNFLNGALSSSRNNFILGLALLLLFVFLLNRLVWMPLLKKYQYYGE